MKKHIENSLNLYLLVNDNLQPYLNFSIHCEFSEKAKGLVRKRKDRQIRINFKCFHLCTGTLKLDDSLIEFREEIRSSGWRAAGVIVASHGAGVIGASHGGGESPPRLLHGAGRQHALQGCQ
jgi:hypothetical protein